MAMHIYNTCETCAMERVRMDTVFLNDNEFVNVLFCSLVFVNLFVQANQPYLLSIILTILFLLLPCVCEVFSYFFSRKIKPDGVSTRGKMLGKAPTKNHIHTAPAK